MTSKVLRNLEETRSGINQCAKDFLSCTGAIRRVWKEAVSETRTEAYRVQETRTSGNRITVDRLPTRTAGFGSVDPSTISRKQENFERVNLPFSETTITFCRQTRK